MTEEWRAIQGFGDHYEVSSLGRVRVKDRTVIKPHSKTGKLVHFHYKGRLLSPAPRSRLGDMAVNLTADGKTTMQSVHRLVLTAFVGPCPDGMECCHNNGNASDNRLENLRWDTHLANNGDRKLHGTYLLGEDHKMAKLSEEQVTEILSLGLRYTEVVRRYGISKSQAFRICKGQAWKHLKKNSEGAGNGN
ncbi:NUMOD4 motif-containing HNH endonuclease [Ralstonia nicotianae]